MRALAVLVAGAVALILLGLQAPQGHADTAPAPGTPATVTDDQLPTWQVNGVVWSQAIVGNTVYVAGAFDKARPPNTLPGDPAEITVGNLFAYDITTGLRVATFNHKLNGAALAITASPDGSRVYVGGDFTTVDNPQDPTHPFIHSHIAAFKTADNTLDAGFNASVNGQVAALTASTSNVLYAGGSFNRSDTAVRVYLAAFNGLTGALGTWQATADGYVMSMVMTPDNSRVIVGGHFTTLKGISAVGMGSLSAVNGEVQPWAANKKITDGGPNSGITSLTTDGTQIYGTGYVFGKPGNFEGTFAADPMTGNIIWVNDCLGDSYDTFPVGQVLYAVSHAHSCASIGAFPEGTSRVNHRALAYTTYPTGMNTGPDVYGNNYTGFQDSSLLTWFPDLLEGPGNAGSHQNQAAWSVTGNSQYISLGGEFPQVNGKDQQGLVRFAVSSLGKTISGLNKKGPKVGTSPVSGVTAKGEAGSILVSWTPTWDPDNEFLTYTIYRDGAKIGTTVQGSTFWNLPLAKYRDVNPPPGSHSYQIGVSDPFGNPTPAATPVGGASASVNPGYVNVPPTARVAHPQCANDTCYFNGLGSTDSDGIITSYSWDFGDGSAPVTGPKPSHNYFNGGTFTVKLTVTDDLGSVGAATTTATETLRPAARITGTPVCTYLECTFAGSGAPASGGNPLATYKWTYGDNSQPLSLPILAGYPGSHFFTQAGIYPVTLTVADTTGAEGSMTIRVRVTASPTTTTLAVAPARRAIVGGAVRLTATVTAFQQVAVQHVGVPTGLVGFYDGTHLIARVGLINGHNAIVTTRLPLGAHNLLALYFPARPLTYSTSRIVVPGFAIVRAPSSVVTRLVPASVRYGTRVRDLVRVLLHGTTLKATGYVELRDGTRRIAIVRLVNGVAVVTLPRLAPGRHGITVIYRGSATSTASNSVRAILTILR